MASDPNRSSENVREGKQFTSEEVRALLGNLEALVGLPRFAIIKMQAPFCPCAACRALVTITKEHGL